MRKCNPQKFKDRGPLPFGDSDAISSKPSLINRAIAMHLLREGQFDVASTFIAEANARPPRSDPPDFAKPLAMANPTIHIYPHHTHDQQMPDLDSSDNKTKGDNEDQEEALSSFPAIPSDHQAWEADFAPSAFRSMALQQQFSSMYHILHELRTNRNLQPAISWAREHSAILEARGSNLEFDLCRIQYINLFMSKVPWEGPLAAVNYARKTFPNFPARYQRRIQKLLGALAFTPNIHTSPYKQLFASHADPASLGASADFFTSEFCALLSLSSASPLLTAVTAGCIALPTLAKLSAIQEAHRTSWTTEAELPVEIPLPPSFNFHSVFVCPVSKEQGTDANPPMMMPCGHVLCKESLERASKGSRFKCPYCPVEMMPWEAARVYL